MLLLVKLLLLPLWLPLKLVGELVEHSGHRRRRHRHLRVNWTPGRAGLTRWTSEVSKTARDGQRTSLDRFVLAPLTMLAVLTVWLLMLYAWLVWWAVLCIALCVMLVV